jgi:hypothetical protein
MAVPLRVFVISAMMAPMPAFADCAGRIAALEADPSLQPPAAAEQTSGPTEAPAVAGPDTAATNEATEVVKDEVVGEGKVVTEGGGETVYQESGPALPRESWFTDLPDKAAAITHLTAAESALDAGDEKACLESVEQAENALTEK